MQTKYRTYNTQSTTSYMNHMIILGLMATSGMSQSYEPNSIFPKNIKQQSIQKDIENKSTNIVKNSIEQIKNANFDFLKVDEQLDKEIDTYFATYTGTNKEILDI